MDEAQQAERPERGSIGAKGWGGESEEVNSEATKRDCASGSTEAVGFVYFLESSDGHYVKIGFTGNPKRRFQQLLTGSPFPLRFLGYMPGTPSDERRIHCDLKSHRHYREWFIGSYAVREFVESLNLTGLTLKSRQQFATACSKTVLIPGSIPVPRVLVTKSSVHKHMIDAAAAGKKGGPARARKLSAKRRQEIARKAAQARWNGKAKRK